MHDPRVSACLARLGGVYRDPARVDRDASCLLKSEVGSNLVPIIAEMYENNGTKFNVLVLQGTIAIHFRGATYQILMDIYLPAGYPNRPPVPYVRLATNMYLKEKHRHVGSDGKVYLPYLHEWRNVSHNLVEMVVAISSVFSADPPVFTRRPTTTTQAAAVGNTSPKPTLRSVVPPPSPPSQVQQQQHTRNASRYEVDAGAMMTDEEAIQAALAQDAKDRAEAERRAMEESLRQEQERSRLEAARLAEERRIMEESLRQEQERARLEAARLLEERKHEQALEEEKRRAAAASEAQKEWERQRTAAVRSQVKAKIRQELQERARKVQHIVGVEIERDLNRLHTTREQKIQIPLQSLTRQKPELERQLAIAEETKRGMEVWIEQATAAANHQEEQQQQAAITVDDKVVPERTLHGQMMELSAENAALTDALFFLDRAMFQGHLSCEVHLKQVRQLAKRQFMVRAHLIKINQQSLASSLPARQ